jgi:hypothetical protein
MSHGSSLYILRTREAGCCSCALCLEVGSVVEFGEKGGCFECVCTEYV